MEGEGRGPGAAMDSGNPLLRAVFLRRLRLTRLLLEGGAYINESDGQGQTPLMVACRTQHSDAQSAGRAKLVQFLLEKGADPNIQDKEGRSALMHACRERAGHEVASQLLASGADMSLEDRTGTSALVHAVMAGDWKVLKLLLDACKAKGKEVIIITTDKFPCGTLQAEQYLSMPPLEQTDTTTAAAAAMAAPPPASPSEIQLITSAQCTSSSLCPPKPVFSFKGGHSHPCSPSRFRGPGQAAVAASSAATATATANGLQQQQQQQQPLMRLNSEPWLKIPASLLSQQDVSLGVPVALDEDEDADGFKRHEARPLSGGEGKDDCAKHAGQKMSLPGLLSLHSASHPNLHSANLGADSASSSSSSSSAAAAASSASAAARNHVHASLHSMASSSLHSIIQRRKLGADIYSSDPQLAADLQGFPEEQRADAKRLAPLRCSSTLGSREPAGPNRRVLSKYERRGSGAFLLDHSSQARPRSLPPLALGAANAPGLNVYNFGAGATAGGGGGGGGGGLCEKEGGLKNFLPAAPPGPPKELTRRMLLRRHSMQTEQFKTTA